MSAIDTTAVDQALDVVEEQVHETVAAARALVVQTPEQAREAVEVLARIKASKQSAREAYDFVVKPFKDQIKRLDARYKDGNEPLAEADKLVREKVLAYETEREAAAAAEQERLNAERRAREAAAEAERQRQAAAATEAERHAREQEETRKRKLHEAQNERAREIAAMSDESLNELLAQRLREGDPEHSIVGEEIHAREERREAQERAEAARVAAEQATAASVVAASAPTVQVTTQRLTSASGSAHTSKHWVGTVVDADQVPLEYRPVDQKLINAAVRAGAREIPGVRIEQVNRLAVR